MRARTLAQNVKLIDLRWTRDGTECVYVASMMLVSLWWVGNCSPSISPYTAENGYYQPLFAHKSSSCSTLCQRVISTKDALRICASNILISYLHACISVALYTKGLFPSQFIVHSDWRVSSWVRSSRLHVYCTVCQVPSRAVYLDPASKIICTVSRKI